MENKDLNKIFKELDKYILIENVNEPASKEKLFKLTEIIETNLRIVMPSDLLELFKWHNGQGNQNIFGKKYNKFLLSIEQVLKIWMFFNDEQSEFLAPYQPHWLPILGDAFGNYVMYDLVTG